MKKQLLILFIVISGVIRSQLPPVAQALYDSCYKKDINRGKYSVDSGAVAIATPDGNSFYLKWFPASATPSATPLMVTLHGSNGNAFNEFYLWHQRAKKKGVGIIALQWYRGDWTSPPNDYFNDTILYTDIDSALRKIKYPSNKAMYHGFSRGSARSYAIAFRDVHSSGKNYFCTIFSNAGKPDSAYPIYGIINGGTYGHTFLTGKKWGMFGGGQDPNQGVSGIQGMNMAKNWVQANGGTVGLFIMDAGLNHNGFCTVDAYMDSALSYYKQCYNFSGLTELSNVKEQRLYPNPTHNSVTINKTDAKTEQLQVINAVGSLVKRVRITEEKTVIDLSDLAPGIYIFILGNEKYKVVKE